MKKFILLFFVGLLPTLCFGGSTRVWEFEQFCDYQETFELNVADDHIFDTGNFSVDLPWYVLLLNEHNNCSGFGYLEDDLWNIWYTNEMLNDSDLIANDLVIVCDLDIDGFADLDLSTVGMPFNQMIFDKDEDDLWFYLNQIYFADGVQGGIELFPRYGSKEEVPNLRLVVVPAPGAVLLATTGLTLIGVVLRRF